MAKHNLTTAEGRRKLPRTGNPTGYRAIYTKVSKGCFVGFRPTPQTWCARWAPKGRKPVFKSFGQVECPSGQDQWDVVLPIAQDWFRQQQGGGFNGNHRATVQEALSAVVKLWTDQDKCPKAARLKRFMDRSLGDFGAMPFADVNGTHTYQWRETLKVGKRGRPIQAQSVDRVVVAITKAAKVAMDPPLRYAGNRDDWRLQKLHDAGDEAPNDDQFLTRQQRQAIVQHATPAYAALYTAMLFTGMRPGEVARLTAADLDLDARTVRTHTTKGGIGRRNRVVPLPQEAVPFFLQAANHRLPKALLFPMWPDGTPWTGAQWGQAWVKAKVAANAMGAGIGDGATTYSARHVRISELLQLAGIDALTVAKMAGNSVRELERSYFRFIKSAAQEKLDRVAAL